MYIDILRPANQQDLMKLALHKTTNENKNSQPLSLAFSKFLLFRKALWKQDAQIGLYIKYLSVKKKMEWDA